MTYYTDNAVYQKLRAHPNPDFMWVSGNAWSLVYGDSNSTPKGMVFVSGTSWARQNEMIDLTERMALMSKLPFIQIQFDDAAPTVSSVLASQGKQPPVEMDLPGLKNFFSSIGLPVNAAGPVKAVNDATSSAYHNWQRANLGKITVSDIDLFRKKKGDRPAEIIELKRSFMSLESWKPYEQDFPNFRLLSNVAQRCKIDLSIIYNVHTKDASTKKTIMDDASKVSCFRFDGTRAHALGRFPFHEVVEDLHRPTIQMPQKRRVKEALSR